MPWFKLAVEAGEQSPLGGSVEIFVPNEAYKAGDPFMISASGMAPSRQHVGYAVPITSAWPTYCGSVGEDGTLDIFGTASADGNLAGGILLAVGVLPPGGISPVGPLEYRAVTMLAAVPAPPAPVASPATLAAAVLASWQSKIPVADWPTQSVQVTFIAQPPYMASPEVVTVSAAECLNHEASQAIATLIGGTVVQVPAPPGYTAFATSPVLVNGIRIVANGVAKVAVAGEVAQSFWQPAGTTLEQMEAAILACFA